MPVPFRDEADLDRHGSAAFLRIVPADAGGAYLGALFLVNAGGEPIEFAYNRIEVAQRFLWRSEDLRRHAQRRLSATLFEICPRLPSVILCRADEVSSELFSSELRVELPIVRLAEESAAPGQTAAETRELVDGDVPLQLYWNGAIPGEDEPGRALVARLAERGLLLEPFERALIGLREVYGSAGGGDGVVERVAAS